MPQEALRIFIGTEESQIVAHRVLEYSIRKHASVPVEITPMLDMPIPMPAAIENRPRVGFSFTRFLIPQLSSYEGRALYLDADMLVFGDVAELATLPFDGNKLLCSHQTEAPEQWRNKKGFRPGRHAAVMLLDCEQLPWKIEDVISGLDEGKYTYEELVHDQCLVSPEAIGDTIPVEWNHLERYEPGVTKLLHYTVVHTQPWRSNANPLGDLWRAAFAEALQAGAVSPEELDDGVSRRHITPSLAALRDLAPGGSRRVDVSAIERELALTRLNLAAAERRIAAMEGSTTWRVGRRFTRALAACKELPGRLSSLARTGERARS